MVNHHNHTVQSSECHQRTPAQVACGLDDSTLRLVDLRSGSPVNTMQGHTKPPLWLGRTIAAPWRLMEVMEMMEMLEWNGFCHESWGDDMGETRNMSICLAKMVIQPLKLVVKQFAHRDSSKNDWESNQTIGILPVKQLSTNKSDILTNMM